jgi:carotenoid phi-ring synthase / carotenoid chi-ring synthase
MLPDDAHTPILFPNGRAAYDAIIIGGGVAGLSAALHLVERGLHPLVLEADNVNLGGRLAGGETIEVEGAKFRLEHGMHGIWSPYRNLQAMIARHNLRPVLVPAVEEEWIFRHGRSVSKAPVGSAIRNSWIPAPFHYLQLFFRPRFLAMLDLRDWLSLPLAWSGLITAVGVDPFGEQQPLEGWQLGDLIRRWPPALKGFFLGLARNGLSAHPDEVPISGFIGFLRFYTIMRRDAWVFSYLPEDGGTSVCEPLGERIRALGGTIHLGARVTKIHHEGGGYLVTWESPGGMQSTRAKHVILATDSKNAQEVLKASFSTEVEDLFFPRGLSNAVVRFWFDKIPHREAEAGVFSGDFMLHNFFWLDRIYNPFRRWGRETGGTVLEAHLYGPPEVLSQPEGAILAQAVVDVQQAWPELRGHVIGQHLQINPATHTLPAVGPADRHLGTVTPWVGLFCAGDWVQHSSPAFFLERACVTGIAAANEVLAAHGLQTWKLIDYLPPEPFVGWIEKLMKRGRAHRREKHKR